MIVRIKKCIEWFQRNERHLSTPLFVAGFINDAFTLRLVPFSYAVLLFGGYSVVAALATIGSHYLHARADAASADGTINESSKEPPVLKTIRVLLALLAQFLTGGLLSGCLIFYTKSAALSASWPFVLLLVVIFIGNEFFRLYREELAFRALLFFFTLYMYVIFALPTFLHTITPQTFIESTAVAVGIFVLFLLGLALAGWKRFLSSFREIAIGTVVIAGLVNLCYFTGVIPPLPLSLQDVGVYHSVVRDGDGYDVQAEPESRPWWDVFNMLPEEVHVVPGNSADDSLSVFSAVFAPVAFDTAEVNRWQEYDSAKHSWITKAEIAFSISGGRDGGYRGYSTLTNITPGHYRVSIETLSGQTIGRIYFNVTATQASVPLTTETK